MKEESARSTATGLSEDELHAVLDEAERRKASELHRTGRTASLIICVPVLLFFVWAGVFLIHHHSTAAEPRTAIPVVPTKAEPQAQDPKEMAGLKEFLPPALGGQKPAKNTPNAGVVVNHEDIRFAMELLNYCRPPSAWKEDAKK